MKDLNSLSNEDLKTFFSSFDHVFSDIDGVMRHVMTNIPGSNYAVRSLKKIGKQVVLITNNTTRSLDNWHQELRSAGFDLEANGVVTPILTMISYLKKQNVTEDIFVLGMTPLKQGLRDAGFTVSNNEPEIIGETLRDFALATAPDDRSVGAVISDFDLNINYVNLQRATIYLEKPEVLFLLGATDVKGPLSPDRWIVGPGNFHRILEEMTGRTGLRMGKPGDAMKEYLEETFKVKDTSRVLFVGDSVPIDMGFATENGYKKLLVLSGLTKKEEIKSWPFPEEYRPDYYVDSLKTVHDAILRISGNLL